MCAPFNLYYMCICLYIMYNVTPTADGIQIVRRVQQTSIITITGSTQHDDLVQALVRSSNSLSILEHLIFTCIVLPSTVLQQYGTQWQMFKRGVPVREA